MRSGCLEGPLEPAPNPTDEAPEFEADQGGQSVRGTYARRLGDHGGKHAGREDIEDPTFVLGQAGGSRSATGLGRAETKALEQVSRALLYESAERGVPTLELSQEELGATLALSRQTVSRVFHDLTREGAIKPERRRVRLLDAEKLRRHVPRSASSATRATRAAPGR